MPRRKEPRQDPSDFRDRDTKRADAALRGSWWRCKKHGLLRDVILLGEVAYCPADDCNLAAILAHSAMRDEWDREWNEGPAVTSAREARSACTEGLDMGSDTKKVSAAAFVREQLTKNTMASRKALTEAFAAARPDMNPTSAGHNVDVALAKMRKRGEIRSSSPGVWELSTGMPEAAPAPVAETRAGDMAEKVTAAKERVEAERAEAEGVIDRGVAGTPTPWGSRHSAPTGGESIAQMLETRSPWNVLRTLERHMGEIDGIRAMPFGSRGHHVDPRSAEPHPERITRRHRARLMRAHFEIVRSEILELMRWMSTDLQEELREYAAHGCLRCAGRGVVMRHRDDPGPNGELVSPCEECQP